MLVQVFRSDVNCVDAARKRVSDVFDEFENVSVSVSGGKDSTVLAHLVLSEAARRGRKAKVFFLDEEVDYAHTIEQIKYIMFKMFPGVAIPVWLQVPFFMTNATSFVDEKLYVWEPGKHKEWMRPKEPFAVQHWPYPPEKTRIHNKNIGFDFYDVLWNWEDNQMRQCSFVGLRALESPNRWRAVSKNPGYKDWYWTTKGRANGNISAYPMYDWNFSDVWRYIYENNIQYNKIYDWMWMKGMSIQEIRVSSLIHERSFKALVELPEFEPKTYNKLCKRVKGVQTANLYGKDPLIMRCRKLPKNYNSWREYRDFLLQTYPRPDLKPIFERRFAGQLENEFVWRQQCRQLILNDYENNLPVKNEEDPREKTIEKWRLLLNE